MPTAAGGKPSPSRPPIPAETFSVLEIENERVIRGILEKAAQAHASGSNLQKVGDFYASGMDTALINRTGVKPLEPEFGRIAVVKTLPQLEREVAHLQMIGVDAVLASVICRTTRIPHR
jgi:putative endopeptidase